MALAVFPVDHPSLRECAGWHKPDDPCDPIGRGKHPACRWSEASTTDPNTAARLFSQGPRNFGIDAGKSRLLMVDEDDPGEFTRAAESVGATIPATFMVDTGRKSGGRHYYFRQPADLPFTNGRGALKDYHVDVRGRGGYVVGPGSVHLTGRRYTAVNWSTPIAPVPMWLKELLTRKTVTTYKPLRDTTVVDHRRAVEGVLQFLSEAIPGTDRNHRLYWSSRRLFERVQGGEIAEPQARRLLLIGACDIGLPNTEAEATIDSARKAVLG